MSSGATASRRTALLAAGFAAWALLALALGARAARATELVYWDNYGAPPEAATIAYANVDGSGGGLLNLSGAEIRAPEGMAYDPVTNRLYIPNAGPIGSEGQIAYVNLDGSGAGVFTAPGAPIKEPDGIAIDPGTRTLYWANNKTGEGSIGWARLDGSQGGTLVTTGAAKPFRPAIDPVGRRLYWTDFEAAARSYWYANLDGSGGGELTLTPPPENSYGMAVDPTAGRLYILDSASTVDALFSTGLDGGAVSAIPLGAANNNGYGLAVDPVLGKAYWGNEHNGKSATNAIGFATLTGTTGGITPAMAPVNRPQDPLIIKSPSGSGAPQLTQSKAALGCSPGAWGPDFPGGNVYQSPRSYSYQWSRNGSAVPGATASTYTATAPGSYACTVTASNQAGSASQSSAGSATVTKAKLKLLAKKRKATAKPGKAATFKVQVRNRGDIGSKAAKLCLKVPKKAKKFLKPARCAKLKPVAAGGKATAKLRVKVLPEAAGAYELKITLPGTKAARVTLKVRG